MSRFNKLVSLFKNHLRCYAISYRIFHLLLRGQKKVITKEDEKYRIELHGHALMNLKLHTGLLFNSTINITLDHPLTQNSQPKSHLSMVLPFLFL